MQTPATICGKYEIVEELGSGGFATAYRCAQPSLGRFVVLKIFDAGLAQSEGIKQRIRREAKATSFVNHPGVVKIFDHGFLEDGRPFLVFELIDGETLSSHLRSHGALSQSEVRCLFVQLSEALRAIHEADVVHRDLTPSNIMLCKDGSEHPDGPRVKILDFGLVRPSGRWGNNTVALTGIGYTVGSPNYMSPEQCFAAEADNRSDIYSLGCVMFEAWTGRTLFCGDEVEVMRAHVYLPVVLEQSNSRDIAEKSLALIIMRCLEKEPRNRYQTCDDVLRDLASESVVWLPRAASNMYARKKQPAASGGIGGPFAKRKTWLTFATVLCCLALLVAFVPSRRLSPRTEVIPVVASASGGSPREEKTSLTGPVYHTNYMRMRPLKDAPPCVLSGEFVGLDGGRYSQLVSLRDKVLTLITAAKRDDIQKKLFAVKSDGTYFIGTSRKYTEVRPGGEKRIHGPIYLLDYVTQVERQVLQDKRYQAGKFPIIEEGLCLNTSPSSDLYGSSIATYSLTDGTKDPLSVMYVFQIGDKTKLIEVGPIQGADGQFAFNSKNELLVSAQLPESRGLTILKFANGKLLPVCNFAEPIWCWNLDANDDIMFVARHGELGRVNTNNHQVERLSHGGLRISQFCDLTISRFCVLSPTCLARLDSGGKPAD